MLYGALNSLVLSYANRKELTAAQVDNFINLALREFDGRELFEFRRKQVTVTYPSNAGLGVVLDGPATLSGQAEVNDPLFRCLHGDYAVSLLATPTFDINNQVGLLVFPIPLHGDTWENIQRRYRWNNPPDPNQWPQVNSNLLPISVQEITYFLRAGGESGDGLPSTKLFLFPEVGAAQIQIDYIQWQKPYNSTTDSVREDTLLKTGSQILLYGALKEIDIFYGEEAKLGIHNNLYEKAIETFLKQETTRLNFQGAAWDLD